MEILIFTQYYVTREYLDYMQYYMMLREQIDHKMAKDLATDIRLNRVQTLARLVM